MPLLKQQMSQTGNHGEWRMKGSVSRRINEKQKKNTHTQWVRHIHGGEAKERQKQNEIISDTRVLYSNESKEKWQKDNISDAVHADIKRNEEKRLDEIYQSWANAM